MELNTNNPAIFEVLRSQAVPLLLGNMEQQQRGRDLLRMVEVLKVRALAKGARIVVTSKEGSKWGRK
jgi:hypothetical protein